MTTKERIYDIINRDTKGDILSRIYDWYMLVMILASVTPLMFVQDYPIFTVIEIVTVIAFIIDYLLRWYCAPLFLKAKQYKKYIKKRLKNKIKGKDKPRLPKQFSEWVYYIRYPFTPMAIVDLLSILPGFGLISPEFKLLRLTRLLKIVRLLKLFRYSDKIEIFFKVLYKERQVLLSVLMLAIFYIFITAMLMFNAEPHISPITGQPTFGDFFDALYWATATLTTVGYGDLCPVTDLGRIVSMFSSIFGIAIIALPSGVITASYLDELRRLRTDTTVPNPSE